MQRCVQNQEHLALLRRIATAAPARFPDLALLSAADEELCFFANVAHLQLHRRVRAFARLAKVKRDIRPRTASVLCFTMHLVVN